MFTTTFQMGLDEHPASSYDLNRTRRVMRSSTYGKNG